ncbi:TetR/AcrR family transcriptional regulator [Clostridium polynesiense]|uniref:TetR/AcrR family transcriptional regulator n=1 Tax=Clostridium polynesiense TaxID=1325933 RepID=UPI00058FBCBD|nr:TetR/AcrR family transcriptional regulator [Clostridium polynesiense]
MRELSSVQEKILDRTLYLIGKNGSSNVSVRAIAKEAEVNVSAINYHFRSKDELLKHVKEFYINNTLSAYSKLENDDYEDEEKVILVANEIMEYSLRYPGIITILKESVNSKEKDEYAYKIMAVTEDMNNKLDKVLDRVLDGSKENFEYNRRIFLSSILYPIINKDTVNFNNDYLSSREYRLRYIKYLVNMLKASKDLPPLSNL